MSFPLTEYDAVMVCDLILSYGWMAAVHALPDPRRHGVHFVGDNYNTWVGGLLKPTPPGERGLQQLTSLPIVTTPLTKEPGGEDPLYYIQHVHSWLAHEEQAALTTGLAALHLSLDLD